VQVFFLYLQVSYTELQENYMHVTKTVRFDWLAVFLAGISFIIFLYFQNLLSYSAIQRQVCNKLSVQCVCLS